MKIVAFLQNAWSPLYAGGKWPRSSWLRALHRSRSGQRLRILTDAAGQQDWWFDNTTPICGDSPDSVIAPDTSHIISVICAQKPDALVALGRQSEIALRELNIRNCPLLIVPHPAHRLLTNDLYVRAGRMIQKGFDGVIEIRQDRGKSTLKRAKELQFA